MARQYKEYKDYTKDERDRYIRLGIRPFTTIKKTTNIRSKDDKKGTTGTPVNTGADKKARASTRNYTRPRVGGPIKKDPVKKGDYYSPKLKDAAKHTPYKTTKKFVPKQKVEKKKDIIKTDDKKNITTTDKKNITTTNTKIPTILQEVKNRKNVEDKTKAVLDNTSDVKVPVVPPADNNISTNEKDYGNEALLAIGAVLVGAAGANKYSKRIQKIIKAIKQSPNKFTKIINKAKNKFTSDKKAIKGLDLRKVKPKKRKPKGRGYKGTKAKPKGEMPAYLGKRGGQVVYRKKSGPVGVGKALRGYGATRMK